jgi:hypothetical protein
MAMPVGSTNCPLPCPKLPHWVIYVITVIINDELKVKQIFSVPITHFASIIDGPSKGYVGIANSVNYLEKFVSMIYLNSEFIPKKEYVLEYLSGTEPLKIFQDKNDSFIIFAKNGITKISTGGKRIW